MFDGECSLPLHHLLSQVLLESGGSDLSLKGSTLSSSLWLQKRRSKDTTHVEILLTSFNFSPTPISSFLGFGRGRRLESLDAQFALRVLDLCLLFLLFLSCLTGWDTEWEVVFNFVILFV